MDETLKNRISFRLSTVLWLMLAASCFLAGKYAGQNPPLPENQLTISSGKSTDLTTDFKIPEVEIDDPLICDFGMLAPNRFRLTGLEPGETQITLTKIDGGQVNYRVIVPDPEID